MVVGATVVVVVVVSAFGQPVTLLYSTFLNFVWVPLYHQQQSASKKATTFDGGWCHSCGGGRCFSTINQSPTKDATTFGGGGTSTSGGGGCVVVSTKESGDGICDSFIPVTSAGNGVASTSNMWKQVDKDIR